MIHWKKSNLPHVAGAYRGSEGRGTRLGPISPHLPTLGRGPALDDLRKRCAGVVPDDPRTTTRRVAKRLCLDRLRRRVEDVEGEGNCLEEMCLLSKNDKTDCSINQHQQIALSRFSWRRLCQFMPIHISYFPNSKEQPNGKISKTRQAPLFWQRSWPWNSHLHPIWFHSCVTLIPNFHIRPAHI